MCRYIFKYLISAKFVRLRQQHLGKHDDLQYYVNKNIKMQGNKNALVCLNFKV